MKIRKVILLILIVLLLLTIFLFSNQTGVKSINVSDKLASVIIDKVATITHKEISLSHKKELIKKSRFLIRKTAHFTLYFTLGILVYLILSTYNLKWKVLYSLLICLILASFDEIHQLFSIGRTAQVYDVFIDTMGSLVGILVTIIFIKIVNKFHFSKQVK